MKEKEMNIIILDEKSYLLKKENQGEILPIETLNMVLNYPNINYTSEVNSIGVAKVITKSNITKYDLYKTNSLGKTKYSRKFLTREELINEAINQIKEKDNFTIKEDFSNNNEEKQTKNIEIKQKKRRKILNFIKK